MKLISRRLILIIAAVAAGALAIVGVLLVTTPVPRPLTSGAAVVGKSIRTGTPAIGGPFTLVSTKGEIVTDQSFRGKWLLLFFGYTFCPHPVPTAPPNVRRAPQEIRRGTPPLPAALLHGD